MMILNDVKSYAVYIVEITQFLNNDTTGVHKCFFRTNSTGEFKVKLNSKAYREERPNNNTI